MGVQPGQEWWTATEKLVNPPLLGVFKTMKPSQVFGTWWLIPLSKWVITPVINGIRSGLIHL